MLRHRQDDDQRSSHYDELLAAETRAIKNAKGLHSKKETPIHRVADLSGVSIFQFVTLNQDPAFGGLVQRNKSCQYEIVCAYQIQIY